MKPFLLALSRASLAIVMFGLSAASIAQDRNERIIKPVPPSREVPAGTSKNPDARPDQGRNQNPNLSPNRGSPNDRQHHGPNHAPSYGGGLRVDTRYRHNQYYPVRGYYLAALPVGALAIGYGGYQWFFHSGVWFRPYGPRFVVSGAPIGAYLPYLPNSFVTLNINGLLYFYANGVYYAQSGNPAGFVVVAPPNGADVAVPEPNYYPAVPAPSPSYPAQPYPTQPAPVQAPPPQARVPAPNGYPEPVIYPRQNQNDAQTAYDQRECERWALSQSSSSANTDVYVRAFAACMDARGYTVR